METDKLHPVERVIDKGIEAFRADLQSVINYMLVDGRPAFSKPLSPQERIDRYMNLATRQEIIDKKLQQGGLAAASDYMKEMKLLIAKEAKKEAQGGQRGQQWPK